ncbi:MAG: sensor histidine kinase [Calditrichaeota bacterium]|nr:MAG: sensor histidine kinase [Calditrichota bacterium]MBL1207303.1 sensor histidine kinase [Calditrichota bacterium]NOG47135.1 HAMP domain-containing protein [Calditrichota bacterium]
MKLQSITVKFILIVSVLMASVLSIQFYFTNQAHEDILSELNRLTKSINTTTEKILVERFENEAIGFGLNDSNHWKVKAPNGHPNEFWHDIEENEVIVSSSDKANPRIEKWISKKKGRSGTTIIDGAQSYEFLFSEDDKMHVLQVDSNRLKLEVIDINLNTPKPASGVSVQSKNKWTKAIGLKPKAERDHILSFEFPTLVSTSNAPQRLRYNYNTEVFSSVLDDIRDRNLLITLSLFGLSLLAIAVIAGKFLKPIKSLYNSFDKVVQGDLDVTVKSKSKDEIGELSTSFNHMVKELRKNKDKEAIMHRQERLASLGQLAAGVAHEIKNPLNAINLTIEHLNDKFISEKEEQASGYIRTIQKEIRRLDKTVNNFLSYLRSENLNKKEANVNNLLDEILNLYEREISNSKIKVSKNYSKECIINLDTERFKTVLMNVIINAIQAMQKGGTVDISTDSASGTIVIKDSGIGIPKKDLENIFDLFYTTKSAGTGLGLPTAHKIVKEHGGELSIESEENKGTVVRIRIKDQRKKVVQ